MAREMPMRIGKALWGIMIGIISLFGIYVALFIIASQRYESRVDLIESRANAVSVLLSNEETRRSAFGRAGVVQRMSCPKKPEFLDPPVTFVSVFGVPALHRETVAWLKGVVEDLKEDLEGANLEGAILRGADLRAANLRAANLEGAILWEADLHAANLGLSGNLTVEQLSGVKTLYETKLASDLMEEMEEKHPHLLEKPTRNHYPHLPIPEEPKREEPTELPFRPKVMDPEE